MSADQSDARLRTDAVGVVHPPAGRGARIVSLVPSITELVCELGLTGALVGRTGFCIHPWERVRKIPKVGGTKDVRLDRLDALSATHVIVNVDENTRETTDALHARGLEVIVTHPLAPADNLALYRLLGAIFDRRERAEQLCDALEAELAAVRAVSRAPQRVLYLIWREPWMTVSRATYISAMLAEVGWQTVPAQSADRYPQIELASLASAVDRVLLSSEPFHFKTEHLAEVRAAMPGTEVSLIDGEMTSWYGSRAITGLRYLAGLADPGGGRIPQAGHSDLQVGGRIPQAGHSDLGEAQRRRLESPCVGICLIDDEHGWCEGCLRTLDEIALWGSSSPAQRREILAAVDDRRARLVS